MAKGKHRRTDKPILTTPLGGGLFVESYAPRNPVEDLIGGEVRFVRPRTLYERITIKKKPKRGKK